VFKYIYCHKLVISQGSCKQKLPKYPFYRWYFVFIIGKRYSNKEKKNNKIVGRRRTTRLFVPSSFFFFPPWFQIL